MNKKACSTNRSIFISNIHLFILILQVFEYIKPVVEQPEIESFLGDVCIFYYVKHVFLDFLLLF